MDDVIIKLSQVNKSFEHKSGVNHVLNNIDLDIYSGDMVAILGPSGSGKSTLLSILGLLDVADSGNYFLSSHDITKLSSYQLSRIRNQNIGWVFQNFNLIGDMTVCENLTVPLRFNADINKSDYYRLIQSALQAVGLEDKIAFYPDQLSGGQQQRVAIARALMCQPDVLLCDEPTGNLDSDNSNQVMGLLRQLNDMGRTIIIITHDLEVASSCQKTYKLTDGVLVQNQEILKDVV